MRYLKNKIVWITGASSGIGEGLAYAFSDKEAIVILSARRLEELQRVKEKCKNSAMVEVLTLDISQIEQIQEKVEHVINKYKKIDILINNAGISQRSLAKDTSFVVYRKIMETNFFGLVRLSQLVNTHFLEKNDGHFININSIAGITGLVNRSAYSASKYAVNGYFSVLMAEQRKTNIRILNVYPIAVKTNISENALTGNGTQNCNPSGNKDALDAAICAKKILIALSSNKKSIWIGNNKHIVLFKLYLWFPFLFSNFNR